MHDTIPPEADRLLTIWRQWTLADPGSVTKGFPSRSAGFLGGGYSQDFDDMVERADKRVGAIADAILNEMARTGYQSQVLAIWNKYLAKVVKVRGNEPELLFDGCRMFLIEAKRRGIAV